MATYYKPQSPIQSGEDFIYPITTADQVKVDKDTRLNAVGVYLKNIDNSTDTTVYGNNADTLGGVAAEDYALKTDTAPDSSKLGGKAPEYYIQPRNLLDNSDFRNPVNQRGLAIGSLIGSGYFFDRWESVGAQFTLAYGENGMELPSGAVIVQKAFLSNKTYTIGVKLNGGAIYTFTFNGVTAVRFDESPITFVVTVTDADGIITNMHIKPMVDCAIEWAALYEGSYTADTLPPYVPKGYAAELAECRRYFQKYSRITFVGRNNQHISFPLPVPMRSNPDFNYSEVYLATSNSSNVFDSYSDKCVPITDKTCVTLIQNFYNGFMSVTFAPVELNADL